PAIFPSSIGSASARPCGRKRDHRSVRSRCSLDRPSCVPTCPGHIVRRTTGAEPFLVNDLILFCCTGHARQASLFISPRLLLRSRRKRNTIAVESQRAQRILLRKYAGGC